MNALGIYQSLTEYGVVENHFNVLHSRIKGLQENAGFKPQNQRPIKVSLQFLLICVFFLLYDIELVFLFPFVSGYTFMGLYDMLLLILFFSVLFVSLNIDYERHALY